MRKSDFAIDKELLQVALLIFSAVSLATLEFIKNVFPAIDAWRVSMATVVYMIILVQVLPTFVLLAADRLIAARDKSGKVLRAFPAEGRLLVEGINFVKKHMRKTRQDDQGGIIQRESPIRASNVMLICKNCNKPTRVRIAVMKDGSRVRSCQKCHEAIG